MPAARLALVVICAGGCAAWSDPEGELQQAPRSRIDTHYPDEPPLFVLVALDAPWYRAAADDRPVPRMPIIAPPGSPTPVIEMELGETRGDLVLVHPRGTERWKCAPWIESPPTNGLRIELWVERAAIVPALVDRVELAWDDGTSVALLPGVAMHVQADSSDALAVAQGMVLRVEPPLAAIDLGYRQADAFALSPYRHWVPGARSLRYGEGRIATGVPPAGALGVDAGGGGDVLVAVHEPHERNGRMLGVVANDCASLVAEVGAVNDGGGPGNGNAWTPSRRARAEREVHHELVFDRLRDEPGELHGWFQVGPAIAYWADGARAGMTQHSSFEFPPRTIGERLCFEQALAPGLVAPMCFDREKVVRIAGKGGRRVDIESWAWPDGGDREQLQVERALVGAHDSVRRCHIETSAASHDVTGRFTLGLVVGADGAVESADLVGQIDWPELIETAACVARAARGWSLPAAAAPYLVEAGWTIRDRG